MDEIYLQKVLSGQKDEFRYFIRTYKDFAYNLALSVVKNEVDAEDAVQDAFIQAYNSLVSFNRKSKFSSWLYRIVVNCAYKQLYRSKRKISDVAIEIEASTDELDSMMAIHVEEEKKYCIQKALELLNPDESLVLQLHYLMEYKIKEIVEITSWSESKAKVTLHRARKSMKAAMIMVLKNEKIIL